MKKIGSLEVICGPMFSGKSEELMRKLRRATIAKQTVVVFKHAFDNRHTLEHITSHDGNQCKAYALMHAADIASHPSLEKSTVVGIDEVQFFSTDIVSVICILIDNGKRVIVAGLDLDFRRVPFGPMPALLALASSITKLQAICISCGSDAHFTQRLINSKPAHYHDPIVLVGAQETYQARCGLCHYVETATRL